jgi:hypothetical protein
MDSNYTAARPTYLPWLFLIITTALGAAGCYLFFLNRETAVPVSWGAAGGVRNGPVDWSNTIQQSLVAPIVASMFGILIVTRRPRHRIGWLLIFIGLSIATGVFVQEWAAYGYYTAPGGLPGWAFAAWVTNWIWVILFSLLLLMVGIFPDGVFLSQQWRRLIILCLLLFAVPLLIGGVIETPMSSAFRIPNPFVRTPHASLYNALFTLGVPFMPLTTVTVLAGLMVRFRRRRGRERQQIKWLLAGVALMTVLILAGLGISFGLGNTLGDVMVNAALLGPLVGIGVALLRHQLYNIDVIIRRTLVYSVLTVLLALVYFGSVVLLQSLVATIEVEQSTSVIVFSTLAIAALFSPLRKRVQEVIDRRFYRRKYDAAQTLAAFAAMARDEVDLDALTAELLHVIDKTIQPSHVSLWIRELET